MDKYGNGIILQDSPRSGLRAQRYAHQCLRRRRFKHGVPQTAWPDEVRPGFRTRHNYASCPGRKATDVLLRSENAEAGSRKTAMRFMRDYASRRAPAMREENFD